MFFFTAVVRLGIGVKVNVCLDVTLLDEYKNSRVSARTVGSQIPLQQACYLLTTFL